MTTSTHTPIVYDPREDRSHPAVLDAVTGVAFAVVATSNLVQGSWSETLPWLNLTALGFLLAVPLTLLSLRHRVSASTVVALLVLVAAMSFGFLEPALSPAGTDKRASLLVSVLAVTVAGVLCLINSRRLRWFFGTIVALALVVLVGQVLVPDPLYLATGRRTPIGLNSIGAGRALGAAVIICSGVALAVRGLRRWLLLLGCIPFAVGIGLAGSRGPLLGVIAGVVLLVALLPTMSLRSKIGLGIAATVVAVGGYRILLSQGLRIVDTTDSGRSALYREAIRIAEEHPLGIGWGNFFRHAQNSLGALEQGDNLYAHNILLEFWIEAGLLGGLLFLVFVLIVLGHGVAIRRSAIGRVLVALALSLFVGALLSSDVIGNRMMWVSCAAILGFAGVAPMMAPERSSNRPPRRLVRRVRRGSTRPRSSTQTGTTTWVP